MVRSQVDNFGLGRHILRDRGARRRLSRGGIPDRENLVVYRFHDR